MIASLPNQARSRSAAKCRRSPLHSVVLLGTRSEPAFDRLTQIASQMLDAKMALLALVDGPRVWLKSAYGTHFTDAPREATFCAHAIYAASCLVVPDARKDARFQTLPAVQDERSVRFYAGAPIISAEGERIGVLCIMDPHPRPGLSKEGQRLLIALAQLASEELELRYRKGLPGHSGASSHSAYEYMLQTLHLEQELRCAISGGELVMHYQPEVDLDSRRVAGFEALVRWQHPKRGLIPPGEFIPIAESSGLILPLGEWGLREACRQVHLWHKCLPIGSTISVSVNLSAEQFTCPDLADTISDILEETEVNPQQLHIEVTESTLMSNADLAHATLVRLRDLGIGLHLDDFGTGYSSLNYLHRFPFDTLKIDRSFVQHIHESPESCQIVRTILDLGRSLRMDVVAEGIENEQQLDCLQNLGCRLGQGYYFSRPQAPAFIGQVLQQGTLPAFPA